MRTCHVAERAKLIIQLKSAAEYAFQFCVTKKIQIIQRRSEIFVGFVKNKRRDKKERFWFLFCDEIKTKTWRVVVHTSPSYIS